MSTGLPIDALEAAIAAALQPFEQIRVAYLFGSRARGSARTDSDLDIALHVGAATSDGPRSALLLSVIAALTDSLGALGERADLLELDRAGSSVAFAVIRDGKCVLCRDPRERVRLEASIARRYDDERPYRELFRRAALRTAERMGKASRG